MLNRAFDFFSLQQQTRRNIVIGLNVAPSISLAILGYLLKASLVGANQDVDAASTPDCDALLKSIPSPDNRGLVGLLTSGDFFSSLLANWEAREIVREVVRGGVCIDELKAVYPHIVEDQLVNEQIRVNARLFRESVYQFFSDHPLVTGAAIIGTTALVYAAHWREPINHDRDRLRTHQPSLSQKFEAAKERTASPSANVSKQSMFAKSKKHSEDQTQTKQKERDVTDEEMTKSVFGKPHHTTTQQTRRRR